MSEMKIIIPENKNIPIIIEHEEFLESDITLNLKFDSYELSYGFTEQCDCGSGENIGISELVVKHKDKIIFSESFNHNWVLFLDIIKKSRLKHEIRIKIFNADDGDVCEICENNRFNFDINALVDSYVYCFYTPPRGEFQKHPLPIEAEELDDKMKEELK